MNLSSETIMKLMAYADGQLDDADRADVEKLLASDKEAASFVAEVGTLGDLLREGTEARYRDRVAAFDTVDDVMEAVEHTKPDAPPARVSAPASLDEARKKRAQRLRVGGAVVAVLALAASIFVFARPKDDEEPLAQAPVQPAPTEPTTAPASGGPGVEVEAVESPGNSVSVFYLPSQNELSTSVVVWVDETGEK